jgi:hypothetical protein
MTTMRECPVRNVETFEISTLRIGHCAADGYGSSTITTIDEARFPDR